jgi:L-alanine-DL-glutamate epimerase-like enolase superfamily enzyme
MEETSVERADANNGLLPSSFVFRLSSSNLTTLTIRAEIWRVDLPLGRGGIQTPVGRFTSWRHLVVLLGDGEGRAGVGYSVFVDGAARERATALARDLLEDCGPALGALLAVERLEERRSGAAAGTLTRAAANAISLAAWDLAGRRLGVACADLWDRRYPEATIPCYASGFFLDVATADLAAEAEGYRRRGYRAAKLRVGAADDAARLRMVREVYAEPETVAVDAVNSWDGSAARDFLAAAAPGLLWVEDPTPYAVIGGVAGAGAPIAGGESLETVADLEGLRADGVDYLLLDVQRLGGPLRFLEAARYLAARGARVGSHMFPHYSTHLLAAVADPLPVECLDWSDALFAAPLGPDGAGRLAVAGPGFGVAVNEGTLARFGERVVEM